MVAPTSKSLPRKKRHMTGWAVVRRWRGRTRKARGFTLLELLVVLAILALLAGLIGPKVLSYLSGARSDTAKLQIKNIEAALDLYKLDTGRYPTDAMGLKALIEKPGNVDRWRGPYLKKKEGLIDPWGQPYIYRLAHDGAEYVIMSLGADKAEGGDGEDRDIRN